MTAPVDAGTDLVDLIAAGFRLGALLLCPATTMPGPSDPLARERRERLHSAVWRLDRAVTTVLGDPAAFAEGLRDLGDPIEQIRPQFLAWIDLLETLVQEAEAAYGSAEGRGEYKQLQVKSAVLYYIDISKVDIPRVPAFLEPILLDFWVGWLSEEIVVLTDRFDLWLHPLPANPSLRRRVAVQVVYRTTQVLTMLRDWLTNLSWTFVLWPNPLAPSVKEAADRIGPRFWGSLDAVPRLLTWASRHKAQVAALIEVVGVAVTDAERFVGLDGEDKKGYATDLIMTFLERQGLASLCDGPAHLLLAAVIDVAIDATVLLFNKRGRFTHRELALAAR